MTTTSTNGSSIHFFGIISRYEKQAFDYWGVFIAGVSLTSVCFGASTDEWIGKAVNAAGALVRGDAEGAAQQAVGGAHVPLAPQMNLSVGLGNIQLQQGIKPLQKLSNPYFNVGGTYNTGAAYGFNRPPNLSQNVQVSGGNPYISNTTTLSGNFDRE